MPIYAYRCDTCGFQQDVLQKMSDARLTVCPSCGNATFQKQVTAAGFQLKGSGWYVTDFRNPAAKAGTKADGAKADGATGEAQAGKGAEGGGEAGSDAAAADKGGGDATAPAAAAPATTDAKPAPAKAPASGST